jgi:hypothetical protein
VAADVLEVSRFGVCQACRTAQPQTQLALITIERWPDVNALACVNASACRQRAQLSGIWLGGTARL